LILSNLAAIQYRETFGEVNMPASFLDIIILAIIAIFLTIKIRNQLGKRDGFDFRNAANSNANKPSVNSTFQLKTENEKLPDYILPESELARSIELIKSRDKNFSFSQFINGAKTAFEMVLKAFSNNDREVLKSLLDKDVLSDFEATLEEEIKNNRKPQTILVAIHDAYLRQAELNGNICRLVVEFVTDQIYVVKDSSDKIVEGNASQVNKVTDSWSFERDIRSNNPNWVVVGT
jgi:predicted lipid-binding transport protein (Tim44 family)